MTSLWPTQDIIDGGPSGTDNPLSPHQRAGLKAIVGTGSPVVILAGRPGTGKTFVAAWVLGQVRRRVGKDRIAVVAPTGKAAVRITEAMAGYSVDVNDATTIHRALEIGRNGHDGKGWGFLRNADNPLDVSLVAVDEASMIDVPLMAALLSAIPDGAHVLICGDPGQLPPVGHGCPLRDMLASGCVPSVVLTDIKRNDGLIVSACRDIAEGRRFRVAPRYDGAKDNLLWIETSSPDDQIATLRRIIDGVRAGTTFDPVWQTQVLVALNEASPVSRVPLNALLQDWLNPVSIDPSAVAPATAPGGPFRLGDKIICLRNSFMGLWEPCATVQEKSWKRPPMTREDSNLIAAQPEATDPSSYVQVRDPAGGVAEAFVANGDVGRVLAVSPTHVVARFMWPDRVVRIELRKAKGADGSPPSDGGNAEGGAAIDFALAYALTTHKSQGSEYPLCIIMVDEQAAMVASKNHFYTSISRGSKCVIVIGRRATAERQMRRDAISGRRTFLAEQIRELATTPKDGAAWRP